MSILLDETTPVIVQGITGRIATFHTADMAEYGTNVVGGVTPGKGGSKHCGVDVFDTMKQAVSATEATASIVFVPPPFAADAIMEAADAGIENCVCITEGIPVQDMINVKRYLRRYLHAKRMCLIGPNCAGVISPGKAMMGIMPSHIYERGPVGIVSRSGNARLRGGVSAQGGGHRGEHQCRHRWRSHQREFVSRPLEALRERQRDRSGSDDRRDRRAAGGAGRGLRP